MPETGLKLRLFFSAGRPVLNQGGGYTIEPPGELPTYLRPDWGGGHKIQPPGELPTFVRPDWTTGTSGEAPLPIPVVVIQD